MCMYVHTLEKKTLKGQCRGYNPGEKEVSPTST